MPRKNLHPSTWGRSAWDFLHSCAQACDAPSAPHYEALVHLLPYVLPCEKCRAHAEAYIATNPPDLSDLRGWLRRFEDHVSEQKRPPAAARCEMPPSGLRRVAKALVLLLVLLVLAACLATSLFRA